jgi:type IV secretory pathway VirB2 component (pilin)
MINTPKNIAKNYNKCRLSGSTGTSCFYMLLLIACFTLLPVYDVYAGMESALESVYGTVTGKLGKGAASLAVIVIGASAMMGKLSWPLAVTTMIGITILFQAKDIAGAFID